VDLPVHPETDQNDNEQICRYVTLSQDQEAWDEVVVIVMSTDP